MKTIHQELEDICKPIVEYIEKNYNTHTEILVTTSNITVKENILGTYISND